MKYLNAQAKKDLFILASYVDFASAYAKNLKLKLAIRYIKTAKTYVEKALVEIIGSLPEAERTSVLKHINAYRISVGFKSEVIKETALVVEQETIDELVKQCSLSTCHNCTKVQHEDCKVLQTFLALHVKPKEGYKKCPYEREEN